MQRHVAVTLKTNDKQIFGIDREITPCRKLTANKKGEKQ